MWPSVLTIHEERPAKPAGIARDRDPILWSDFTVTMFRRFPVLCVHTWRMALWHMVVGINLLRIDLFLIVIARERLERDKIRARESRSLSSWNGAGKEGKREKRFITRLYCKRALYRGENINPERVARCAFIPAGFTRRGAPRRCTIDTLAASVCRSKKIERMLP